MNRSKSDKLPQMQIQFLQAVCIPLYKVIFFLRIVLISWFNLNQIFFKGLSNSNELLSAMSDGCEANLREWQKMIK